MPKALTKEEIAKKMRANMALLGPGNPWRQFFMGRVLNRTKPLRKRRR